MTFGLNLVMLIGLAGMAIPILIHLLNRRRFEVVDWGAMQFLQVSEAMRRRLLIEEILLLLLRMSLIALLVLALAAPWVESSVLAGLSHGNRDVVLVIDGSSSMSYTGSGQSAHDAAREWARAFVDELAAGDSVAILQAKEQVVPVLGTLTHDLERVRDRLANLPEPGGSCNWPQALQAAQKLLADSQRTRRDIIVLSDNQRFGWADDNTLLRWELLASTLREGPSAQPQVWVVNLAAERPATPPNWSLAPIRASRAIASVGQQVTFRTALEVRGQEEYSPPYALRVEIDGKPVTTDLKAPATAKLERGQLPLSFHHRFTTPGSHLVTVIVDPDPPPEQRPAGYVIKDHLPGDNRRDFAVEIVPALPVLLIDGGDRNTTAKRGAEFLRDALAPARDLTPVVAARLVGIDELEPALLTADIGKEPGSKPRVLVLVNVARLTAEQQEAITGFLGNGGGVLVTLGERSDARHYNDDLYRGGQGWLPARLEEVVGDEARPERAPTPLTASFFHPALDLFRDVPAGGLSEARFPRWWKVSTPGRGAGSVPIALLTSNDPLFVEKAYRGGRVILSAVPWDKSWRSNLPDLPAFVPLAHELVYYLAGARAAEHNLQPGQPLRYHADTQAAVEHVELQPPSGKTRPLRYADAVGDDAYPAQLLRQPQGVLVVYEETRQTGIYRLIPADGAPVYYVVPPDPRESDLTPASEEDRQKVARLVPMKYENDLAAMREQMVQTTQRQELWWWLMLGVIALLCGEVWMTRRMVKNR